MTCGASHGLQLILNTLLPSTGTIFVEEVTYMDALDIFTQFTSMKIITGKDRATGASFATPAR